MQVTIVALCRPGVRSPDPAADDAGERASRSFRRTRSLVTAQGSLGSSNWRRWSRTKTSSAFPPVTRIATTCRRTADLLIAEQASEARRLAAPRQQCRLAVRGVRPQRAPSLRTRLLGFRASLASAAGAFQLSAQVSDRTNRGRGQRKHASDRDCDPVVRARETMPNRRVVGRNEKRPR